MPILRSRHAPSQSTVPNMRSLFAAATYFGLVFGAGFVLGAIRVPFLVPRLGERVAELAEMPVMFVVIVFAARFVVRRFGTPPTVISWLRVGILALAFLVGAELALATLLQSRSVADYVASRDPVSGGVYLAMLGVFALMPAVVARVARHARTP